jgi:hypothetical protein
MAFLHVLHHVILWFLRAFFLHVLHHVMLWFLRAFVRYPLFFIHNVYHTSMKLAILKMSNLMLLLIHEP